MKHLKKADRIIVIVLLAAILLSVLLYSRDTFTNKNTTNNQQADQPGLKDYDGKKIGSATGTTYDKSIIKNLPNAIISYYNSYGDMVAALEAGKIDGFCADDTVVRYMMLNNDRVSYIPDPLESYDFAFAFPKKKSGKDLCDQFSAFIQKMESEGKLQELDEKWFGKDESACKGPDTDRLPAKEGTLTLATETENPPFSFVIEGKPAGYEIDLAYLFCKEYGYGLKISNSRFDAILAALDTGKADFAASGLTVTEERAQNVYFSYPHYIGGAVLAVRASDLPGSSADGSGGKGILQSIAESFEKTFIRENRWKMILAGIGVTCLITILSTIFGTLLAFLICVFRRLDSLLAGKIADLYVKILQGTPIVVLLLILYYLIFARSSLTAMTVAVIGFSLNFAAYTSEIMRYGIESIDGGQREAALALGYTETQAFFRFVFPQAAMNFLPIYRGEIVSLLKNTSVVGYIAIQDLTKVSDIIRSRTYEAFFPLIATAVIYFALSWIISYSVEFLIHTVDPKSENASGADISEISLSVIDIAEKGGLGK